MSLLILILLSSCDFTIGGFDGLDVPPRLAGTWVNETEGVRVEITYDNIVIYYENADHSVDLGQMVWYDQDAYTITSDSNSFTITADNALSKEHDYSFQLTEENILTMTSHTYAGDEKVTSLMLTSS